jgi:putative protease
LDDRYDSLAETFSRGFTTAYLEDERGNDMMSYTRPNNRGVTLGRVTSLNKGIVGVEIGKRVVKGDVLEFRTSRGRSVVTLEQFWASPSEQGEPCEEAPADTRIYLRVPNPVAIGDRVFRVRSAELLDAAKSTYGSTVFSGNNGLVEIDAQVIVRQGDPLSITFTTAASTLSATALGAPVEPARTKALTEDDLREHVGRIGGTPFTIRSWDIQLDEGVGIGFSTLHKLRSEALETLTEDLLKPWHHRRLSPQQKLPALAPARRGKVSVAAIVTDAAHAKAAAQAGADALYLHSLHFEAVDETGSPQAGKLPAGLPVTRLLPTIAHDSELDSLLGSIKHDQPAVANNLGELKLLREYGKPFEAGPSLGVYNLETLNTLARLGATQAWLSPELSYENIGQLSAVAPLLLALTVSGQQEVMVTEHCVLMAQGPCNQDCATCARRKAPRLLEDRKGYRFPVRTDNYGRSHIFNSVPLDLTPSMPELVSLGISTLVVDGTLLTTKELKAEVERVVRARDLAVKGAGSLPKREGYTTGHFFRGIY